MTQTQPPKFASVAGKRPAGTPVVLQVVGAVLLLLGSLGSFLAYCQFSRQLANLCTDLNHLDGDLRAKLETLTQDRATRLKKEDCTARFHTILDRVNEMQAQRSQVLALKEQTELLCGLYHAGAQEWRASLTEARALGQKVAGDQNRELLQQVHALHQRLSELEGTQRLTGAGE